jgi:hypothetical protein
MDSDGMAAASKPNFSDRKKKRKKQKEKSINQ